MNLRKIIDGKDPSHPEFYAQNAPLPQKKAPDDVDESDPHGMAQHVADHLTDPLEQTKEGFEGLTNAKLNYEMEKEKMRRQLLPVQSVIQHVNQLHQLQDQYGTHPVDPNVQNDANMGYQEERQGVPPNMQQQPGMMQQSNPNRNVAPPGVGPKIPTPPMGAEPAQKQSKGVAPKPPGAGKQFPGTKKKTGAKAPGPGQGKGIEVHVKAATMAAPGASRPLVSTFAAEKVRQMSSHGPGCKMESQGERMAHVSMPNPGMSRSVTTPARMSQTRVGGSTGRMLESDSLTMKQRKNIPDKNFVFPDKAPGPGSFPINDRKRAKAALAYRRHASDPGKVVRKVRKKFPDLGKDEMEAKAPPGWEGTVKHMKKHSDITNPYALAWYMDKKGDTPHHE